LNRKKKFNILRGGGNSSKKKDKRKKDQVITKKGREKIGLQKRKFTMWT